jgi:hypothetical protein
MFIGFLLFVLIFLMAFWMMLFLAGFVPYWIAGYFIDLANERKQAAAEKASE